MTGTAVTAAPEISPLSTGSATLLATRIVGNAGFFVAALILARALGPAERGTMAFITVTALSAATLTGAGVMEAGTVFLARQGADRRSLVTTMYVFATLSAGIGALLFVGAMHAFDVRPFGMGDRELLVLGAGMVAIGIWDAGFASFIGLSRFRAQGLIQVTFVWAYAVTLGVLWIVDRLDLFSAVLAWAASWAFGALLSTFVLRRSPGLGRPALSTVGPMLAFGSQAWIGSVSLFLNFRLDQVLMGFISKRTELGLYAVAVNAAEVALYVPQAISIALLPRIAAADAADRVDSALRAVRVMLVSTAAGVVVGGGLGALLLPTVFGDAYTGSVGPFLWLLPGALGFAAMRGIGSALAASGHPGRSSAGAVASLVAGLAADIVLIPPYGATGAAIAATLAFWVGAVASAIVYRRVAPFALRLLVPGREDARAALAAVRRSRGALRRNGA